MSSPINNDRRPTASELAVLIEAAMDGLQFGSVEIVIHESKVVQIERREKIRLQNSKVETSGAAAPKH